MTDIGPHFDTGERNPYIMGYPDLIRVVGDDNRFPAYQLREGGRKIGMLEVYNDWIHRTPCVLWFEVVRELLRSP